MKPIVRPLYFLSIAIISFFSDGLKADPAFEQKLNALIEQQLPHASVGLVIQDLQNGNIVFQKQADSNFYPASNTKLFTAAAALKGLGPDFSFQTSIHAPQNKIKNGILNHPLYVVFRGDPSLTTEDLSELIKQIKYQGIQQIQGNIIIDDQTFSGPAYGPGWTWDSMPWAYSAPITTIILNENKVRLMLHKPTALRQPIIAEQIDKNFPALKIKTEIRAVPLAESEHSCELRVNSAHNDLQLTGCWAFDKTPAVIELALDDPRQLAKKVINEALKKNHIPFSGKILFAKTPKDLPVLVGKSSLPLKMLVIKMLQDSNNVYAESMTKALGLSLNAQGTFQAGTQAIKEILSKEKQIEFTNTRLSDGSGQSRYNLASPLLVSQLLYAMYHDPLFPFFYNALSTAGKNGTLATRFKATRAEGKIVAKTGSATGTSALSGYLVTHQGQHYLFSLLINQSSHDYKSLKSFEDTLCQWLLEEPWENQA